MNADRMNLYVSISECMPNDSANPMQKTSKNSDIIMKMSRTCFILGESPEKKSELYIKFINAPVKKVLCVIFCMPNLCGI